MKKSAAVAVVLVALLAVGGGLAVFAQLAAPPDSGGGAAGSAALASSAYLEYTPEGVSSAPEGERIVLFFHAQWCPTCKVLDDDIMADVERIPEGVRILRADFDTETSLKQQYGVTVQHTLVQIDVDGTLITKWNLSPTLAALVAEMR